jgi:hypothetical protein
MQPVPFTTKSTDASSRALGGMPLVPHATEASPSEMGAQPLDALAPDFITFFEKDLPFYRPSAMDIARTIGWRWVLLVPIILVLAAFPVMFFLPPAVMMQFLQVELKLVLLALGGGITIVLWAVRNAINTRTDLFCIHCGYNLDGLTDEGTCPECGRNFKHKIIREFKKDPHFFIARWKAVQTAPKATPFSAGEGPTPYDGT